MLRPPPLVELSSYRQQTPPNAGNSRNPLVSKYFKSGAAPIHPQTEISMPGGSLLEVYAWLPCQTPVPVGR
jgi:hypothetical protein